MSIKKLILALVSATVVVTVVNMMIPDFIGKLASSNYKGVREDPLLHFHMLALLVHAFLLAFIYPLVYQGGTPWLEGLRFGLLAALLISLPAALHQYALIDAPAQNQFLPVLWTMFVNSIAGIVVALIYGRNAYPARIRVPKPAVSELEPSTP